MRRCDTSGRARPSPRAGRGQLVQDAPGSGAGPLAAPVHEQRWLLLISRVPAAARPRPGWAAAHRKRPKGRVLSDEPTMKHRTCGVWHCQPTLRDTVSMAIGTVRPRPRERTPPDVTDMALTGRTRSGSPELVDGSNPASPSPRGHDQQYVSAAWSRWSCTRPSSGTPSRAVTTRRIRRELKLRGACKYP